MKKYGLIFILFSLIAITYLSFPLSSNDHFVSIKDENFFLDDKEFYPITLNYMVSVQTDGKELWACTYTGYNNGFVNRYTTKDSCLMQLKADMTRVKEMGFNTVRIVAIGEEMVNKKTGELTIGARIKNERNELLVLSDEASYNKYFAALEDLFEVINGAHLKMIFLTRMSVDIRSTEDHLRKLAIRFKDDPTILAYDLFNEPLYFDSLERNKKDAYDAVKRWNKTLKMYAPNQLSTIGLAGVREVFEWDPNIMDVDFVSFHPYEYEPEMVRNEMYWYYKYMKKPWMLGETAIPADNDSVPYTEQSKFANKTLHQAFNCGAVGYSWWQYKDVEWYSYHANFMGVVRLDEKTKPVAEEFRKFKPEKTDSCLCLSNYYNYTKFTDSRITGKLKDNDGNPIIGGVILAWNQWWSKSYITITKQDGSFEILGNFPFYHWMASATEYSMVRGDVLPDTAKIVNDKTPTMNLGTLKLSKLPFLD
jgi:hypothetical protein